MTANHHRPVFDRDTCARMLADYRNLLRGMVDHPDAPLARLGHHGPAAARRRPGPRARRHGARAGRPVHELVGEQVRLRPGATAVRYGDRR